MSRVNLKFTSTQKQIAENLPSNQIAIILDILLFKAIEPIVLHTNLLDITLASLINKVYCDHRRKLATIDRTLLINRIYKIIMCDKKVEKLSILKTMELERSIHTQIIDNFLECEKTYLELESLYVDAKNKSKCNISSKMHKYELKYECPRVYFSSSLKTVKHYYNLYLMFKERIIMTYVRYAYQQSEAAARNTKLVIDQQALFDNLVLAINKAINKYSPKRGTLKAYVDKWFMDAKTNPEFDHNISNSYKVSTTSQRKMSRLYSLGASSEMNLAVDLDSINETDLIDNDTVENKLLQLASEKDLINLINITPDCRIAKLILDIPYIFNKEELLQFKQVEIA